MDFSKRHREAEMMDDLRLSSADLKRTYRDIGRANRLLGGDRGILVALNRLISKNVQKNYSIIDVGCGDGTLLRKIDRFFRKRGLQVHLKGIDLNEKAIALAKESSANHPAIEYAVVDMLQKEPLHLTGDIVISTLTLHHISEEHVPFFLERLVKMTRMAIIISDLQRSWFAYLLFKLFSVIFIQTKIAKNDGLVSIRSGFRKKELLRYSKRLSGLDHEIRSKWAFRYVWLMQIKRQTAHE
ncbi:MAG: methyltransferase domain-containing protein [Aurantibacter sp.]